MFSPGCLRIVAHYPFQSAGIAAMLLCYNCVKYQPRYIEHDKLQLAAMVERLAAGAMQCKERQALTPGGTDVDDVLSV